MEIVAPDQLPDLPKGDKDYGYQVIVKHRDYQLHTYNGEMFCPTVKSRDELPIGVALGARWFVGEDEFVFDNVYGWVPVGDKSEDIVNHPSHYTRGPKIKVWQQGSWTPVERVLECIEVIRWITDGRLYNAVKYIWRVAFGGKAYDGMTLKESMRKDIEKAQWYLKDWLDNPIT